MSAIEVNSKLSIIDGFLYDKELKQVIDPESKRSLDDLGFRSLFQKYSNKVLCIHDAFDNLDEVYIVSCSSLFKEISNKVVRFVYSINTFEHMSTDRKPLTKNSEEVPLIPVYDGGRVFYIWNKDKREDVSGFDTSSFPSFLPYVDIPVHSVQDEEIHSKRRRISITTDRHDTKIFDDTVDLDELVMKESERTDSCERFHEKWQYVQVTILKYQSLIDLVDYLQRILTHSYPYINYPQYQVLNLILTATTTNENSILEEGLLKSTFKEAGAIPLSNRASNYLQDLLDVAQKPMNWLDEEDTDTAMTFAHELKNLRELLFQTFGFLSLENTRPGRRNASERGSRVSSSADEQFSRSDSDTAFQNGLKNLQFFSEMEWLSRTDLFGNTNFDELGRDPWDYFLWGFKCAIKGLTKHDDISRLTWNIWKNVLYLILQYYQLEWKQLDGDGCAEYSLAELNKLDSRFFANVLSLGRGELDDGFYELVKLALIESLDSLEKIKPIMESDLILRDTFKYVPDLLDPEEEESALGLESIPLRRKLILLGYDYITLMTPTAQLKHRHKYLQEVCNCLLKIPTSDFRHFFIVMGNYSSADEAFLSKIALKITYILIDINVSKYRCLEEAIDAIISLDIDPAENERVSILLKFLLGLDKKLAHSDCAERIQASGWKLEDTILSKEEEGEVHEIYVIE
ncbi:hypothetical protein FOA43_000633 [Brettanomyces nanus]|uniref:Sir1 ORC-binding domain-containing protein n=1 Tax=Eeniella nana TaxID=13502 RepID=A0A875RXN8_EENNA|nr:uncharacterized protein FOA43_000633 [Brettanomyces nanus]QPG73323.1 hypothetical protein FOA43_000633 [Brettanomyces nanus]